MNLDLNERECEYLVDLVREHHKSLLHELHHVDTARFEQKLRETISMNETILSKLAALVKVA